MAEACYVPNYLPASYKGVSFEALAVNSQHGRRGAQGEFPFGEETAYADLGRKIRTYSIAGRFATNDHIERAAALIAVCELPGPGILVHPTRGVLTVACQQLRVADDPDASGGVTTFDMDMVEANLFPNGLLSLATSLLGLDLGPLIDAVGESFLANYIMEDVTFYDVGAVRAASVVAISSLADAYQQSTANKDDIKIYRGIAALNTLAQDPGRLYNADTTLTAMQNGFALVDKYAEGTDKIQYFRTIINLNSGYYLVGRTGEASLNALQSAMRAMGAGYMARAVLETTPKDMNEAFTQYDQIVTVFQQELDIAKERCDDRLYVKLARFFETVKSQLLNRAYNSPSLVQYKFAGSTHSLVAAYEIYNDAARFVEIETRNPSGLPWQVGPGVIASRATR